MSNHTAALHAKVSSALNGHYKFRTDDDNNIHILPYDGFLVVITASVNGLMFLVHPIDKDASGQNKMICAPKERRIAVARVMAQFSFRFNIGNWEMDFNDGEVRFRASLAVSRDHALPSDMGDDVRYYVELCVTTFKRTVGQIFEAAGRVVTDGEGKDSSNGDDALHHACRVVPEDLPLVQGLVASGTPVDVRNKSRITPLMAAVCKGNKQVSEFLISRGANVNADNDNQDSPLSLAVFKQQPQVAAMLLNKGARAHHIDKFGDTPLMDAARWGYVDLVKLLLAKGAVVNHVNKKGETALSRAREANSPEIIRILKDAGANEVIQVS